MSLMNLAHRGVTASAGIENAGLITKLEGSARVTGWFDGGEEKLEALCGS